MVEVGLGPDGSPRERRSLRVGRASAGPVGGIARQQDRGGRHRGRRRDERPGGGRLQAAEGRGIRRLRTLPRRCVSRTGGGVVGRGRKDLRIDDRTRGSRSRGARKRDGRSRRCGTRVVRRTVTRRRNVGRGSGRTRVRGGVMEWNSRRRMGRRRPGRRGRARRRGRKRDRRRWRPGRRRGDRQRRLRPRGYCGDWPRRCHDRLRRCGSRGCRCSSGGCRCGSRVRRCGSGRCWCGSRGSRRGGPAGVLTVEVEPEVEVRVRVVRRRLGRRRLSRRGAAEQVQERRVDVHRIDRRRGAVGAGAYRLGGLEHGYRAVSRAGDLLREVLRRVVGRSRTVTLPARRRRLRAGLPGRWGSGHATAPFGHAARAAKLVIPTPPGPGCEWRQVAGPAARRPVRGCASSP